MLALRIAFTVFVVAIAGVVVTPANAQGPPIDFGYHYQQGTLQFEFGVDQRGTVDPETGAVRIGGTLSCNEPAAVDEFFGFFGQGQTEGAIELVVTDGCSGRWTATVYPYLNGPFHPGKVAFFIQVAMINNTGFAAFPHVEGSIVLRPERLSE
jgi:hypothetical protein